MTDNREAVIRKIEELHTELLKFEQHDRSLPPNALRELNSQLVGLHRFLKGTR